jgi:hypothetical protein
MGHVERCRDLWSLLLEIKWMYRFIEKNEYNSKELAFGIGNVEESNKMGRYGPYVITEILSAHGDKNSTSSNSNEVIHGTELISQHSKKVKNYTK